MIALPRPLAAIRSDKGTLQGVAAIALNPTADFKTGEELDQWLVVDADGVPSWVDGRALQIVDAAIHAAVLAAIAVIAEEPPQPRTAAA